MAKQWEKRIIIFQYIYSCILKEDFSVEDIPKEISNNLEIFNVLEYALINFEKIKNKISKLLNINWTWDRIPNIDKSILIASYSEFKVSGIDKKIIIDQAIITSKNYSDEESYKFINFILDRILNAKV